MIGGIRMAIDLEALAEGFEDEPNILKIQRGSRRGEDFPRRQKKQNRRYQAPKMEEKMKKDNITEPEVKKPNPFWAAVDAARAIKTRRPQEEQPKEMAALKEALASLDDGDKERILWRLVKEVLEDEAPVPCLFPMARECHMMTVAYNAACLRRVIVEGDLTLDDLKVGGLAEIKINEKKRPYIVYYVGKESLSNGQTKLREAGKNRAADIISEHLRKADRHKELERAARAARNAASAEKAT